MKPTILMIAGALALVVNVHAQEFNPGSGYLMHPRETVHQQIGRSLDSMAQTMAAKEAREEALLNAAAAQAEAEAKALKEAQAKQRFYEACRQQDLNNQLRDEAYYRARGGRVLEGDRLPLWEQYDDLATIRIYLRDSGYSDLSDAQILKVHSYMQAHQIRHVSELGQ